MKRECEGCGSTAVAYEAVEGWAPIRTQGGANKIAERKPLRRYLCTACMAARQVARPGQGTLA